MDTSAESCPKCGVSVGPTKSVSVAAVASAIFPGLGQIINGETVKAVVFILVGVLMLYLIFGFSQTILLEVGLLGYTVLWLYNVYDAINTANKAITGEG